MERAAHLLQKDQASPPALPTALLNIARGERSRASATLDARDYSTAGWRTSNGGDSRAALRPLQNALDAEIEGLERDVLYLEALLDQQATQDMLALTRELASRRRQLADLMEKYRKSPTPQLKAAIAAQLARLQERMNELFARLSELGKGLSDEHLNRQALEELARNQDMVGGVDKVKKLLDQGDLEGALKALDELGNSLDAEQKQLQNAAGEAGQKFPELARKVDALSKDLGKLTDEEKKLAGDTEQVRQRYRKALEQHSPASPAMLAKLKEEVALAKGQLDQIPDGALPQGLFGEDPLGTTRERVTELGRALDVKDLDQALHSAEQAVVGAQEIEGGLGREAEMAKAYGGALAGEPAGADKLAQAHGHAEAAVPALEQVRAELSKLFPDQDRLLSPADRKRMGELSQRQAQLRDQLGQVQKDIQDVQKSAPLFDPSAGKKMEQAGGEMRGAQHSLNGRQPGKAVEQEQGAVEQLDGLAQSMKKMAKGGGGSGGQPFPMPFASGEGEGGGQGDQEQSFDREKVVIPGADQYRVPPEFRRDILDAMRQKAPQQYEDQVKKYYQEIVR
jgi:chromosome segregation ATPase